MPGRDKLAEFTAWCEQHTNREGTFRSGTSAKIYLDHQIYALTPDEIKIVEGKAK